MTLSLLGEINRCRFRLLICWKKELLARDAFRIPELSAFPHRVVVCLFDEIVGLLRRSVCGETVDARRGRPVIQANAPPLTMDQYAEILWAGRSVILAFFEEGKSTAQFSEAARGELRTRLQDIFVGLVEREIRELRRLQALRIEEIIARRGASERDAEPLAEDLRRERDANRRTHRRLRAVSSSS